MAALGATAALGLGTAAPAHAAEPDDQPPELAPTCVSVYEDYGLLFERYAVAHNRCDHPVRVKFIVSWWFDSDCVSLERHEKLRHLISYTGKIDRLVDC